MNISLSKINNKIKNKKDLWEKELILKRMSSLEYFKFYKIPLTISYKDKTIKIEEILNVLQTFSVKLFPQGRTFINNEKESFVLKRDIKKDFKKLFNPNYICSFKKEELIKKIAIYFSYSLEVSATIIDFLTTDTSKSKQNVDISLNPFLRIGEKIYWLSSFSKDRKWENLLHRKLWREKIINQQEISSKNEKNVSEKFIDAGFNSISSYNYNWNSNKGEIDVLAYKDKTLFVVELKNTIVFEKMLHNKNYETRMFHTKAADQLDRAVNYINENFDLLKEKLDINCSLKPEFD